MLINKEDVINILNAELTKLNTKISLSPALSLDKMGYVNTFIVVDKIRNSVERIFPVAVGGL